MKIVVIGAGLSGLAAAYRLHQSGHDVTVLESGDRPGGRSTTLRQDGFVIDAGANIMAESYTNYLKLARSVGLGDAIVPSSKVVAGVRDGRVIDIDTGSVASMIFTPLLSWGAKLRMALGFWKLRGIMKSIDGAMLTNTPEHDDPATTAERFALDHFGREATDYMIDPLIRMVGGSVPARISALLVPGGLGAFSSALISIRGGLGTVPEAIAKQLDVVYRARVASVQDTGSGVHIAYDDAQGNRQSVDADGCIIATHIDDAEKLWPELLRYSGDFVRKLKYARLGDIKLAYGAATRSKAHVVQLPSREDKKLLMYSLDHHKAPDRAPPGHSLLVLYTDDAAADELFPQSDEAVLQWARSLMEKLHPELKGHFLFGRFDRYPRAGYLVDPGYFRRAATLRAALPKNSRIQIAGDVFGGGSMEVAVTAGENAASTLAAFLADEQHALTKAPSAINMRQESRHSIAHK